MTFIMEYIGPILIAIITVCFLVCSLVAIASVRLSSKISQDEDSGAPEGWHQPKIN